MFSDGDPLDPGVANHVDKIEFALDSTDKIYYVFEGSAGSRDTLHLSRFVGTAPSTDCAIKPSSSSFVIPLQNNKAVIIYL